MTNSPHSFSPFEHPTFRALLLLSGRNPASFAVKAEPGGLVRVDGPNKAVCYSLDGWTAHFGRDLYKGVYDEAEEHRRAS